MESNNNLKKRLYQNLLNKAPKQNHLLGNDQHTKSAILKPKVIQQIMNTTAKMTSPVFNKGKLKLQTLAKSPQIPKKIAPISIKDGLSKQGKAVIQQGKLRSKANLKPHDIFAFYEAFPQMVQDFFYLNRVGHPYDYQIVTYSQRNPNQYMTISSKGVTLYHEKQAQFMTKDEWLADQKIYYSLQKIQFFKQYKISKNFTIWKNRMRRHYMKQMSHLLSQSLFFSFEHPRHCLLEIRKITNHLKDSTYFMPSDSIQSMDSQLFLQNALSYIDLVFMNKIKDVQNMISQELQKAITQQIKKFKIQNNIKIADVGDHDQKDQKQGYVYSQQAILRKQYKKVHKLIKLADNILLQSKIQLIQRCITQLLQKIQQVRTQQSKQQWINCSALPVSDDHSNATQNRIVWHPTMDGLKDIFKTIITQTVSRMNQKYEKISSRQKFQKYKTNEQNQSRKDQKRNSLKYMIEDSQFYGPLIKKINFYLERQFKRTQLQESQLIKFIDIYSKHKSLPTIKEIFSQNSAAQYCQLVRQWKQDNQDMQLLPDNKSVGLLVFNYSELRKKMITAPSQTLTAFLAYLPEQTSSRCRDLLHQSKQLLQMINVYPTDISSFVTFNKAVRLATQKLDYLMDSGKQVIQMVSLIQQNKLANIDIYKGRSKQAMISITNLKSKVDQSNAKYDQSLSKFKKQLEENTVEVKRVVKQLKSKFQIIPFDNIASPILATLQKIHQILPSIQQLQRKALQIQQIQSQLSLPSSQLDQIHVLYNRSQVINQLWQCKRQWNQLLEEIYNKHYKQIDCQQLRVKWQQFSFKNNKLQKMLSDNQVLKKLISSISEFQNLLQTISALTSPNLQDKSWREISEYLAYQLNIENSTNLPFSDRQDPQYTVQWLIKKNISLYKEKITFIVQKSQKQKQLLANLGQFRAYISSITFETVVKKRQISLIQPNQNLKQNLKQKISILYTLIGNQYSEALINEAETLIKHYEYMQEILQGMYEFRRQWQKYEPFFETTAVSTKLLTKQSKQFTSWELQWKKIIKNIINDPGYFYRKICDETLGINCSRAIIKSMNKANMFLDLVKKGIEQFLQKKRTQFARYCLFTDSQLLSILQKLDNNHLINQQVVSLLYDNIKSIQYDQQGGCIVSITSAENIKFPLIKQSTFKSQSQMEDILKTTQQLIKKTMAHLMKNAFFKYIEEDSPREQLLAQNNVQVALAVDYIAWVRLAQQTYLINDPVGNYTDWLNIQEQQLRQVSSLMKKCPQPQYFKYLQFMAQSIYFRQKTLQLAKNNISQATSYEWQRIPKMIMPNSQIFMKQLQNKILYNYELLNQTDCVILQAETERVWINLINAISSKAMIGLRGSWTQSVKDLAFYVGQTIKSIKFTDESNIKSVERILIGYLYLGCWMHFAPITNLEIISYIAYHISSGKRANNFQSTATTLQLTKSNMLTTSLSNAVFLFEAGQVLVQRNLIDTKNFRTVSLIMPDYKNFVSVLCEAENIPKELGVKLMNMCTFCRQTFAFGNIFTHDFQRKLLKVIKQNTLPKFSQQQLSDGQILDYIILNALDESITMYFTKNDTQLFQNYRTAVLQSQNLSLLKSKFKNRLDKQSLQVHPVQKYIDQVVKQNILTQQFISQAIKVYDMLIETNKFGLVLSGPILSGKSYMINFIQKVYKYVNPNNNLEVNKIYSNAYKIQDIIKYSVQQKRQKKEKNQKLQKLQKQKAERFNSQVGILQSFLKGQALEKWIIFDGQLQKQLTKFTNETFQNLLVSNYGIISKQKAKKVNLEKIKIIKQISNTNDVSPSVFCNFNVCFLPSTTITPHSLVAQFFAKPSVKKYLKSLNPQSIQYLKNQLITNLNKVQQKGNIKSKSLQFLYPLAQNQISIKTLKLIECVLKINQQSIRQKQKNMNKMIDKFVYWVIGIVLYLHVDVDNQNKLQKRFVQTCKCQNIFNNDSFIKYIVYPGSGIQIHPINGLRTQSSLFEIPQKGIITLTIKNDFNDFNSSMNSKGNKFYQEICLEDISSIRVNYDQSNMFSYYSQLFAYCNQPIVLSGPVGSGKKSILQLYAKNIRHKSYIHSIRHHKSKNLMETYEKPFRRYNSLNGVVLKSNSVNKNVVVFIEDLNMVKQEKQTLQFLRMLVNDGKFINKNSQKRMLTQQANSLTILTNRLNNDETVLRLCSRMIFFQTSKLTPQKISTIFLPYLDAWGKSNSLHGQIQRIFCSQNGDGLLDATIKVVQAMQQMYKIKKIQQNYSLQTILLKPRIGDISKVLSFICRTSDANRYTLQYYSQLWASQTLRVFDDRIGPCNQDMSKSLMELMKKQFFLKFKQNMLISNKDNLIFTNILSEQNKYYQKIQDMQNLQQFIINLIESQTITVPVKLFFNELLKEIMKIYRIIQIDNGHIVILNLNKKVRQYLIELACQVAESNFIPLKQKVISVEKDILPTLDLDQNVCIFEDIDDITPQQIYQFSCLLNKNYYDYELKAQTKQKLKNRLSKYMRNMFNQYNISKQSSVTNIQKQRVQYQKQKQNIYLNQKLQDQLQYTMQETFMNNVHFIFGASPLNQKTKRFLLNETDLVGELHFSYFNIPNQSLLQISKQILTLQEQNVSQSQIQQNTTSTKPSQQQSKSKKQQTVQRILNKCVNIYKSLQQSDQNFNQLLCICQNIINQRQKLQNQSKVRVQELQKCIQNYNKAKILIQQKQQKLILTQLQLKQIKKEQAIMSQKLQQKTNEINQIHLTINDSNQNDQSQESQKSLKLKLKNQELEQIQLELREIKMKKDRNDLQSRQSRKIIQLSKDFITIIEDIATVEQKLKKQKNVQNHYEDLLIIWWCIISYLGNKSTAQIIVQVNDWIKIIDLKQHQTVQTAQDLFQMFQYVVQSMDINVAAWQALSPQNRFKGVTFIYTLIHQEFTTSTNRIITLYDPYRIYSVIFKYLPIDSDLGNFTLGNVLRRYDDNFWVQIQKTRKGLIFLQETIQPRQKKDIQKIILQRNVLQLNRFVALVNTPQKADISFKFQKNHFVNYLKLLSLLSNQQKDASLLMKLRQQYMKQVKKLKQSQQQFRKKCALMKFDLQSDTQQITKLKVQISHLQTKLTSDKESMRLNKLKVKDQNIIVKIVNKVYEYMDRQKEKRNGKIIFTIQTLEKLYKIVSQKISKTINDMRSEQKQQQAKLQQSNAQTKLKQNPHSQRAFTTRNIQKSHTAIYQSPPSLIQVPSTFSQTVQCFPSPNNLQTLYSTQQLQTINQLLQQILNNNLNSLNQVTGDDIFQLQVLSLELENKVPVIVVQNNLSNYSFMSKQNRPVNLLYNNLSNLLIENSTFIEQKNCYICNKILLFYNDNVHNSVLNELIAKYQQQYISSKGQRKYFIYLFTNSPLLLLQKYQNNSQNNYKLFFYQSAVNGSKYRQNLKQSINNQSFMKKSYFNNNSLTILNQKSSKAQLYIKLVEFLSGKKSYYNMAQIERFIETLEIKNGNLQEQQQGQNIDSYVFCAQLSKYLLDISPLTERQNQLVQKIVNEQINHQKINQLMQPFQSQNYIQSSQPINQTKQTSNDFIYQNTFSQSLYEQIQEELPNIFNTGEFIQLTNKDCLCNQVEGLAKNYNKKVKKVKYLMDQNLKQHTLELRKIVYNDQDSNIDHRLYVLPSASHLRKLNKQYKVLKKLLIHNGLIIGPSPSMGKIVSTKGIGNNNSCSQSNIIFKNCLNLQDLYFDKKIINELKIRASRKYKVPLNRIGLMWYLQKKGENCMMNFGNQKVLSTALSQMTLSVSATLQNCELKNSMFSKQEKDSHRLLANIHHSLSKQVKLLIVPYDINSQSETGNLGNIGNSFVHQLHSMVKKQTMFINGVKKQDNNKDKIVEFTKVKIVQSAQNGQIQLGFVEMLSSQINAFDAPIKIPKIVINRLK